MKVLIYIGYQQKELDYNDFIQGNQIGGTEVVSLKLAEQLYKYGFETYFGGQIKSGFHNNVEWLDIIGCKSKHFDVVISDPRKKFHNTDGHKLLLPHIKENIKPNDIVVKLDSDAFFIKDVDESLFDLVDEHGFLSIHEPRHELDLNYKTPHPVFYAFKGEYLSDGLDVQLCTIRVENSNWWGSVNGWIRSKNIDWFALERSNETNLHPIYFAIYGDLIYHNWAGSRLMRTREDRRRAANEGISLDEVIRQNHQLNESVLKALDTDVDEFIKVLKTK